MLRSTKSYYIGATLLFLVFGGVRMATAADLKDVPATVMDRVVPVEARVGDVITVEGESLDAAHLKAVYLTDRKEQLEVEIIAQTPKSLRFKLPKVAPGKWRIAIELVRDNMFLEEPVFVIVLPDKG
jgi:hypothetical protein